MMSVNGKIPLNKPLSFSQYLHGMDDLLHLDEACCCGSRHASAPEGFGDQAWLKCRQCGTPVMVWSEYKQAMLAKAAEQIRRRTAISQGERWVSRKFRSNSTTG
jgi:hypothetical protein